MPEVVLPNTGNKATPRIEAISAYSIAVVPLSFFRRSRSRRRRVLTGVAPWCCLHGGEMPCIEHVPAEEGVNLLPKIVASVVTEASLHAVEIPADTGEFGRHSRGNVKKAGDQREKHCRGNDHVFNCHSSAVAVEKGTD